MRPETGDSAYLWDMRDYSVRIRTLIEDVDHDHFLSDEMLQAAVERYLEIIGDAAGQISAELRRRHAEIQWRRIIGLRNVLIHRYPEVDLDIV